MPEIETTDTENAMKPNLPQRGREALHYSAATAGVGAAIVFGTVYDNPGLIEGRDTVRSLWFLAGGGAAATLAACVVSIRLGRVMPLVLYLVFSSGAWLALNVGGAWMNLYWSRFMGVASLVAIVLAVDWLYNRTKRTRAARLTAIVGLAMGVGTSLAVARDLGWYGREPEAGLTALDGWALEAVAAVTPEQLPDILYIVPDRYASAGTLAREYGFDNRAFYRELERRGFSVRQDAVANYARTELSLASTLNSTYLERLTERYGTNTGDRKPAFRMIQENTIQKVLRTHGYRIENYGAPRGPTRIIRAADLNYQGYKTHFENEVTVFEQAVLRRIAKFTKRGKREGAGWLFGPEQTCGRVKRKLNLLSEMGNEKRPVFAFVHMMVPHGPILMDAQGRCLKAPMREEEAGENFNSYKAAYIEYLRYFNKAVLNIIERQTRRRRNGGRDMIVVIQSDEGPRPKKRWVEGGKFRFDSYDARERNMKAGILNAVLIQDRGTKLLDGEPTPINNWRIILDAMLETTTRRLDHRAFLPGDRDSVYDFKEITDDVLGVLAETNSRTSRPEPGRG